MVEGPTDEGLLELLRTLQKECFAGKADDLQTAGSSRPVLDRTKVTFKATSRYLSAGMKSARGD